MSTDNGTAWMVEVPRGSKRTADDYLPAARGTPPWEDRREWVPVCFVDSDIGWQVWSERPPCPPTVFKSEADAEAKLRHVKHRLEILQASGKQNHAGRPLVPNLGVFLEARVGPATLLELAADFEAEVAVERRATKLEMLREQERSARSALKTEEDEIAKPRAGAKGDLERLKLAARTGATDWAGLGGIEKVQHRRRQDGTETFRARVSGETSESFSTVEEAVAWRDSKGEITPAALLGAEGSRPA